MPAANPTPPAIDPARLRKALSFALRHNPWAFGLDLTEDGFAPLDELVASLRSRRPEYYAGTTGELTAAVCNLDPERFEVRNGRVRARYGHSFPVHRFGPTVVPPDALFHGTTDGTTLAICR